MIDNAGQSSLYYACINRNEEIVNILVEKGATVIKDQESIAKELCQAGHDGDLQLIQLFHKSEVDLNLANFDGRTVGHLASSDNQLEILKYLAKNTKFNFLAKDRWENTTLQQLINNQ